MRDVMDALDRMQPATDERGNWEAVLRDARVRPRRTLVRPLSALGIAVAAVFALALFQPWDGESPTVLERALAAVDDGPVLHVVLRDDWHGTLIDLGTGERRRIHGEREVWYDPARGLHSLSRFGGVVQGDVVYAPDEIPRFEAKTFGLLGEDYRRALESGRARNLGAGEAYGMPVYWIRVDAEWLPDAADGKLHEWAHDVAISRETFEPVATRETRDGRPGPDTGARILELETLDSGEGDFTAANDDALDTLAFGGRQEPISRGQAADALGQAPLWLGRQHEGLPLGQVSRTTTAVARQQATQLGEAAAAEVRECLEVREEAQRMSDECRRTLRRYGSIMMRGKRVYTLETGQWGPERTGVKLFYGTVGDEPSTYREDDVPLFDRRHVTVSQATHAGPDFDRGARGYAPPEGSIVVFGRMGKLRRDGLYVTIEASTEELVLSAARALEPMSR
jgi:hypothetical protein